MILVPTKKLSKGSLWWGLRLAPASLATPTEALLNTLVQNCSTSRTYYSLSVPVNGCLLGTGITSQAPSPNNKLKWTEGVVERSQKPRTPQRRPNIIKKIQDILWLRYLTAQDHCCGINRDSLASDGWTHQSIIGWQYVNLQCFLNFNKKSSGARSLIIIISVY
jgi:hypothetical protein